MKTKKGLRLTEEGLMTNRAAAQKLLDETMSTLEYKNDVRAALTNLEVVLADIAKVRASEHDGTDFGEYFGYMDVVLQHCEVMLEKNEATETQLSEYVIEATVLTQGDIINKHPGSDVLAMMFFLKALFRHFKGEQDAAWIFTRHAASLAKSAVNAFLPN